MIFYYVITTSCLIINQVSGAVISSDKRNIAPDNNSDNLETPGNPMHVNYDEYPLVVPKRAAMLLDKIMVALHHALEDEKDGSRKISDVYGNRKSQSIMPKYTVGLNAERPGIKDFTNGITEDYDIYSELPTELDGRELKINNPQHEDNRRGHNSDGVGPHKGRVYWRCYFNAVTCF